MRDLLLLAIHLLVTLAKFLGPGIGGPASSDRNVVVGTQRYVSNAEAGLQDNLIIEKRLGALA
jgi:hypothetical protein